MSKILIIILVSPKLSKVSWMSDNYVEAAARGDRLRIGDPLIEPSAHIKVLGSMLSYDGSEKHAYFANHDTLYGYGIL